MALTSRERVRAAIDHRSADRIPVKDVFWIATTARWEEEGMPPGADLAEMFGWDLFYLYIDSSMRFAEKLLEETDEYRIWEDKLGYTNKTYKTGPSASNVGGYLSHRVPTRVEWEANRHRLSMTPGESPRLLLSSYAKAFVPAVTWEQVVARFKQLREAGRFVVFFAYGPYEATWRHHGFDQTLLDWAADPGLLSEMFEAHISFLTKILDDLAARDLVPDGLFISEDIAYRNGPYFSPRSYRKLLYPHHRRLGDYLHNRGLDFFFHSDGDLRLLLPSLIDAGVNVVQPLEAQAGLDVVELKKLYGRNLTFMGNISVKAMAESDEEIEAEIARKIPAAMKDGGYIFHSDHSVPPDVSWSRYQHVMELVHRYGTYAG